MRVADVSPMTGEVDPGIVAENLSDIRAEAHEQKLRRIVSFVNTNCSYDQSI